MANQNQGKDQPRKNQAGKGSDDRAKEGLTRGGSGKDRQDQNKERPSDNKRGAQPGRNG